MIIKRIRFEGPFSVNLNYKKHVVCGSENVINKQTALPVEIKDKPKNAFKILQQYWKWSVLTLIRSWAIYCAIKLLYNTVVRKIG